MAGRRNDKPIRRAGLISPFGVGATVDYADGQSLITSAIDHWPFSIDTCPAELKINEERLCDALNVSEIRFLLHSALSRKCKRARIGTIPRLP